MIERVQALCLLAGGFLAVGCKTSTRHAIPSNPSLGISARLIDPQKVEFTVTTNLPTPLAAMASLDLQGLKGTDKAIGTSRKVTLAGPTTIFIVDTINDSYLDGRKPLPTGSYDADVIVGPKWDENKGIADLPQKLEAKQTIQLHSDRTAAQLMRQNVLQTWIMDSMTPTAPWDEKRYKERLGPYEKSRVTSILDAYYFPEANMTLIVSNVRRQVLIWRNGRAAQ